MGDSTDGSSDKGSENDLEEGPNGYSGEGSIHNPDGAPCNGGSVMARASLLSSSFMCAMPCQTYLHCLT